jgi:hypothetical protein
MSITNLRVRVATSDDLLTIIALLEKERESKTSETLKFPMVFFEITIPVIQDLIKQNLIFITFSYASDKIIACTIFFSKQDAMILSLFSEFLSSNDG